MENQATNNNANFVCSGQCTQCQFQQRVYCAAYLARNNYAMMNAMLGKIDALQVEIKDLNARINAMQNVEGELMHPFNVKEELSFETTKHNGASGVDE